MMDEDTGELLTLLFLVFCAIWLVAVFLFNLLKVIGSLLHWPLLGRFPLNVGTFCVLLCIGWVLLVVGFRPIFRALGKRSDC
jgi:Mn2+/Fe2+ NRAMP family transporter